MQPATQFNPLAQYFFFAIHVTRDLLSPVYYRKQVSQRKCVLCQTLKSLLMAKYSTMGRLFRWTRQRLGYSVRQMAPQLGVSKSSLSRYERGERSAGRKVHDILVKLSGCQSLQELSKMST